MKTNICSDCKQTIVTPADSCGTGYAVLPDDSRVCYSCADKRQVAELLDRSKPTCGYVGSGSITTWTGGKLMTITRAWPCTLTRQSFTHSKSGYLSIHAVDVHGGHWAGRGSAGIAIRMRPVKGRAVKAADWLG